MKIIIIDGNNLIGKSNLLREIQRKNKQIVREKLVLLLESFFQTKKNKVFLYFDGYENLPIKTNLFKIIYSDNYSADDKIRQQIENTKNTKNIILITSDRSLQNFARACSCDVISSENFLTEMNTTNEIDEEKAKTESMKNNIDEFKKLFNVK
jgi:predicted RNA-binding protein with PIN domain